MSYQFGTELKQVQDRINQFLANQFEEIDSYNAPLRDAMKYGLLPVSYTHLTLPTTLRV